MRINVNPNAEVSQFNPVKAGTYSLRIEAVEQLEGPKGPYLKWRMAITTSTDEICGIDGEALKGAPSSIFAITSLIPEAQFKLRQLVEAAGLAWDDFDTEDLLGKEISAKVDERTYEGTVSNEVKVYLT